MKALMRIFSLGVVLVFFFLLNICTITTVEATEITGVSTGAVEIKATVPSDFTYPLLIQLSHENGTKLSIPLTSDDGYELTQEGIPSGKYLVLIGGGYDENGSYALPAGYVIKHPTILVVVGNRSNLLECSIGYKSDDRQIESTDRISEEYITEQDTAVPTEGETEQSTADVQQNTSEVKQAKEPAEEVGKVQTPDESLENAEKQQKPNLGKEFVKKNIFSLLILIGLCVVIIVIKINNDLLR